MGVGGRLWFYIAPLAFNVAPVPSQRFRSFLSFYVPK